MAADASGSITGALAELKAGDADAATQQLWERYFGRLVRLARSRLRAVRRSVSDEEDVAIGAFESFCAAASRGRFPRLEDREDLWKLLVTITARKAADLAQHERRDRRGGGHVLNVTDLGGAGARGDGDVLALIAGEAPSPEFAAEVAEEYRRLLGILEARRDGEELCRIAMDRLAGYSDTEIARRLGCTRRTVQRKLVIIRNSWRGEVLR